MGVWESPRNREGGALSKIFPRMPLILRGHLSPSHLSGEFALPAFDAASVWSDWPLERFPLYSLKRWRFPQTDNFKWKFLSVFVIFIINLIYQNLILTKYFSV
jgi:hypothetical protein